MAKFLTCLCALIIISLLVSYAGEFRIFTTDYTTIYYIKKSDISLFLWRISGEKIDIQSYPAFAKSRIDRIVEHVQALLDMYPENFSIKIYIYPKYRSGKIAFYSRETKSIIVFADRINEAILAHELSHAIIDAYFKISIPNKVSEILCQYVDKHLWFE